MTLPEIEGGLDDQFRLLTGGSRTAMRRVLPVPWGSSTLARTI